MASSVSDEFWQQLQELWESDDKITLSDATRKIALKLNVTPPNASNIHRYSKRHQWVKHKDASNAKVLAQFNAEKLRRHEKKATQKIREVQAKQKQGLEVSCEEIDLIISAEPSAKTRKKDAQIPSIDTVDSNSAKRNKKIAQKEAQNIDETIIEDENPTAQKVIDELNESEITGEFIPKKDDVPVVSYEQRKKITILKAQLKASMIIKMNRELAFDIHIITDRAAAIISDCLDKIIDMTDPEEAELINEKMSLAIKAANAAVALATTQEKTSKISAVYWGLTIDDLKDLEEQQKMRDINIEASQNRIAEAKKATAQGKKDALLRKLEIIKMESEMHGEETT